jgi:hypothetical protein
MTRIFSLDSVCPLSEKTNYATLRRLADFRLIKHFTMVNICTSLVYHTIVRQYASRGQQSIFVDFIWVSLTSLTHTDMKRFLRGTN